MKPLLFSLTILILLSCNSNHHQNNENADSNTDKDIQKDSVIISQEASNVSISEGDFFENEEFVFEIDTLLYEIALSPKGNYKALKRQIINDRHIFHEKYVKYLADSMKLSKLLDTVRMYVTKTLVNKIIPFWYGMPWDFSGYSDIPNEGTVGCSYFISNTLKHCGFNLNRYKLAQQNTKNIALSIQTDSNIWFTKNPDFEFDRKKFIEEKREGLYYIGLNSHVGYLIPQRRIVFYPVKLWK